MRSSTQRLRHQLQYLLGALGHILIVFGYRLPYWPMMRFSSNTLFDNIRNMLLKEKSRHAEPSRYKTA